jgi:uncharacterized DUF497 family protein
MSVKYELILNDGTCALTFEWDTIKEANNRSKHGIGFEEAANIFQNEVLTAKDQSSISEYREISFGRLSAGFDATLVLCVVHVERNKNIRIISARKATRKERRYFDDHFEKTYH